MDIFCYIDLDIICYNNTIWCGIYTNCVCSDDEIFIRSILMMEMVKSTISCCSLWQKQWTNEPRKFATFKLHAVKQLRVVYTHIVHPIQFNPSLSCFSVDYLFLARIGYTRTLEFYFHFYVSNGIMDCVTMGKCFKQKPFFVAHKFSHNKIFLFS